MVQRIEYILALRAQGPVARWAGRVPPHARPAPARPWHVAAQAKPRRKACASLKSRIVSFESLLNLLWAFMGLGALGGLAWSETRRVGCDWRARAGRLLAVVFAIIAFVDVPITFFATRFLPTGLHPAVITSSGSGMAASMLLTFLVCMAGMTLLLVAMLRLELAHAAVLAEVEELKELLDSEPESHLPTVAGSSSLETERGLL